MWNKICVTKTVLTLHFADMRIVAGTAGMEPSLHKVRNQNCVILRVAVA